MNVRAHSALYRRFCSCYPKAFREEYGEDLVTTFAQQLAEQGAANCWLRTLRDLAITIPVQHLEPPMKRPTSSQVTVVCLALAVGGTMAAVVVGTSLYALILLGFAAAAITVAVMSRRAAKPALALEGSTSWKKFLGAGAVLLAIIIVLINLPGTKNQELSELAWSVMMISMLLSFALIGAGLILGAARLSNNRHR